MILKEQVESYCNEVVNGDLLTVYLTEGAKFIIDNIPPEKAEFYATEFTVTSEGLPIGQIRVIRADKNGYGARYGRPDYRAEYSANDSLLRATNTDPIYTIYNGKVYIYPDGGKLIGISYPTVNYNDETIENFNPLMTKGAVLYASIQELMHKIATEIINISTINLTLPTAPIFPTISYTYIDATASTIGTVTFDTLTYTPTFTKPNITLTDAPSVLDLSSITLPTEPSALDLSTITPPSAPTLNNITYTDAELGTYTTVDIGNITLPSFTAPTVTLTNAPNELDLSSIVLPSLPSDLSLSDLTPPTPPTLVDINYTDATLGSYQSVSLDSVEVPTYTKPTNDISFTNLETYISTEEDGEKAVAEVNQIRAKIENLQQNIYNELNAFNSDLEAKKLSLDRIKEQARLNLQKIIEEANKTTDLNVQNKANQLRALIEKNVALINKYAADVNLYQARVNSKVNEYGSNLEKTKLALDNVRVQIQKATDEYNLNLQRFVHLRTSELNKYQLDITKEREKFNSEIDNVKATLDKAIEQARLNLQKIIEQANKTTDLNIQNRANQLRALIEDNVSKLNNYATEINKYQARINSVIGEYTANLDRYKSLLDATNLKIRKAVEEYTANLNRFSALRTSELNKYQLDIENERARFNEDIEMFRANVERMLEKARIDRDRLIEQARLETDIDARNKLNDLNKQIAQAEAQLKLLDAKLSQYQIDTNAAIDQYKLSIETKLKNIDSYKELIAICREELKTVVSAL